MNTAFQFYPSENNSVSANALNREQLILTNEIAKQCEYLQDIYYVSPDCYLDFGLSARLNLIVDFKPGWEHLQTRLTREISVAICPQTVTLFTFKDILAHIAYQVSSVKAEEFQQAYEHRDTENTLLLPLSSAAITTSLQST